jgi:hypothetical protein
VPYAVVGAYSKNPEVALPFGFALPFSVALASVRFVAAPVVGGHGRVTNMASLPALVPLAFVAVARK